MSRLGTLDAKLHRIKRYFFQRWRILVVGVILVGSINSGAPAALSQAREKKGSRNVEIHSDQIELLEVQAGAERCPDQKKATTIRLKVNSKTPLDVKVFAHITGSTWVGKDFFNKQHGDEITTYLCDTHPRFKIYAHEAGSTKPWPKP